MTPVEFDQAVNLFAERFPVFAAEIRSLQAALAERTRERDEARCFGEDAATRYNELLARGLTLRCAFCDAEYPKGTPPTQCDALTAHVMVCEKHPLRAALSASQAEVARLRPAAEALRDFESWLGRDTRRRAHFGKSFGMVNLTLEDANQYSYHATEQTLPAAILSALAKAEGAT